jgi:hypothetical protein
MSKGSRMVGIRLESWMEERILERIARNNATRREEEWTISSWIRDAIMEKLAHQDRATLQKEKRRADREGRMERLARLRARDFPHDPLNGQFNGSWKLLAELGRCDAMGSMEYERVIGEWIAADRPGHVATFITRRVNIGSAGEMTSTTVELSADDFRVMPPAGPPRG